MVRSCSPWHPRFPPEPPQVGRAFPCSAPSSVIPRIPTPPRRSYPASRSSLFLDRTALRQPIRRPPGSRACGFPTCWALRLRGMVRPLALSRLHLSPSPPDHRVGIPNKFFGAQSPSPPFPLFTLRRTPRDVQRKTRGQNGSLFLSCRALSSPTTCRFIRKQSPCPRQQNLIRLRSIIRHGPLRSSDLAHLGALLLSSIQPGGFLAAPAGAEPGDARRAALWTLALH